MTLDRLTSAQRATIEELVRRCPGVRVCFLGVDAYCDPVLAVTDTRRSFVMAVRRGGEGADPMGAPRELTEQEELDFEPDHFALLCCTDPIHTYIKETGHDLPECR